jgi:NAD(P)-dependent dehydrogenase (short-subunit alcohol dehydrogenase family)
VYINLTYIVQLENTPVFSGNNLAFEQTTTMTLNVLVTGASRGIGKATAILAGARGWNVGVNYLNNAKLADEIVATIQASGGQAVALQGDMSKEEDVLRVFDDMEKAFGPLHGVVVNAGITAPIMPLAEMTTERLRGVFDVNIFGAYLCAREAARRLPKTPGDADRSIVFVSSAAARLGSPNEYVDYAGSKGAIDTLTIGLSKELGPKSVRVNGIRPGIIRTDIHESSGDVGRIERLGNAAPLGRAGEAEEVAEAIVWLTSTQSSYVTGSIIDVAGGR